MLIPFVSTRGFLFRLLPRYVPLHNFGGTGGWGNRFRLTGWAAGGSGGNRHLLSLGGSIQNDQRTKCFVLKGMDCGGQWHGWGLAYLPMWWGYWRRRRAGPVFILLISTYGWMIGGGMAAGPRRLPLSPRWPDHGSGGPQGRVPIVVCRVIWEGMSKSRVNNLVIQKNNYLSPVPLPEGIRYLPLKWGFFCAIPYKDIIIYQIQ